MTCSHHFLAVTNTPTTPSADFTAVLLWGVCSWERQDGSVALGGEKGMWGLEFYLILNITWCKRQQFFLTFQSCHVVHLSLTPPSCKHRSMQTWRFVETNVFLFFKILISIRKGGGLLKMAFPLLVAIDKKSQVFPHCKTQDHRIY